jgi:three-Cys-motif partner protein
MKPGKVSKSSLVKASDGLPARPTGRWAEEKAFALERLFFIFNQGMKNRWATRIYVDLLAGPGRSVIRDTKAEVDGSPILALKCPVPFTHYFFNDADPRALDALQRRAAAWPSAQVEYFCCDCNTVVPDLLTRLPERGLFLCFVDQTKWECAFATLLELACRRRMDLLVTFHTGNIKRVAGNAPSTLDTFFGDPLWPRSGSSRGLLDHYENRLAGLGYERDNIHDQVLIRNTKSTPMYHLLFVSKHARGKDFWEKATQRTASGQVRMDLN